MADAVAGAGAGETEPGTGPALDTFGFGGAAGDPGAPGRAGTAASGGGEDEWGSGWVVAPFELCAVGATRSDELYTLEFDLLLFGTLLSSTTGMSMVSWLSV